MTLPDDDFDLEVAGKVGPTRPPLRFTSVDQ